MDKKKLISLWGLYGDGCSKNVSTYSNDDMLLSPYQDLNGHTKCNVIFEPVDRKVVVISANHELA